MRKYILKFTKTGKEWKSFIKGVEFLEDNKLYRMEWELEGLWTAIRGWWCIVTKRQGEYIWI